MKNKLSAVLALALFVGTHQAAAQETRFFRVSGPAATAITAFRQDGTMVWSNAQPGATYTIQTASSVPGGGAIWTDYVQIPTTSELTTNRLIDFNPPAGMVLIPAGSFTMGNSVAADTDIPGATPVSATVSAFYMDVNEVTKTLWETIRTWATANGYSFSFNSGFGKAANHPVQTVNWYDCVKWCNARSQQAGRTPAYYTDAALTQVYKTGQVAPYVNWNAGYRLPTEAEWEKAARGGLSGQRFPWGNVINQNLANYSAATASYSYDLGPDGFNTIGSIGGISPATSPVGSFAANGYGLHDMAGNVYEWCWDWYGTLYAGGSDPRGPASGSSRVARGGSWGSGPERARCAQRPLSNPPPNLANNEVGFRSVLPPGQP